MALALSGGMLIDEILPHHDVTQVRTLHVNAPPEEVYRAARGIDLMQVTTPTVSFLTWLRAVPDRIQRRLQHEAVQPPPARLTLDDLQQEGWLLLGEEPQVEVVFGAVGKFYKPAIEWVPIPSPEAFVAFSEPGYCKLACHLRVTPTADGNSEVRYEARTATTDEVSQRRFRRYWRIIGPFAGHLMNAALRHIAKNATTSHLRAV